MVVGIGGGGEVGLPEAWDSFVLRAVRSLKFPAGSFSILLGADRNGQEC